MACELSRAGCWGEWVACAEQLKTVFKLYYIALW